tara:strand:- start:89451 stop:89651 length:201 start_codon:yes stop_codon:yes gene_type:complete
VDTDAVAPPHLLFSLSSSPPSFTSFPINSIKNGTMINTAKAQYKLTTLNQPNSKVADGVTYDRPDG